jgi:hypothetical protein
MQDLLQIMPQRQERLQDDIALGVLTRVVRGDRQVRLRIAQDVVRQVGLLDARAA